MNRAAVFMLIVGAFTLSSAASGGSVSASTDCVNGDCVTTASSSLISIILAVSLALFLAYYPQRLNAIDNTRVVGVWRRFGAFCLDFAFIQTIAAPWAALPLLLAEAGHTGTFRWSFVRDFARPDDWLYVLPAVLAMFLVLLLHFYSHARIGRQTPGQYVLGYRIVKAEGAGEPEYGLRVILSFVGLSAWPISVILALRNPRKAFWWDAATGTSVARVA